MGNRRFIGRPPDRRVLRLAAEQMRAAYASDAKMCGPTSGLRSALRALRATGLLCLAGLFLAACASTPEVNPNRPRESMVAVKADRLWQPSGLRVRRGEVVQCTATGRWSDAFSRYGPEGNPDTIKDHLGVAAPASGLLMRIGEYTNRVFFIGQETNVVADRSGELQFRNNVSLPKGMNGELAVRVRAAPDADRDGVSDHDELFVWKTNPLLKDSDGDGFDDLEEINDLIYRPSAAAPGP